MAGRAVPARATSPLSRGLPGHSCHDPGLAPQVGLAERGLLGASPPRASPDRNSDHKTGDSHGSRESHLGTPARAERVGPARPIASPPAPCGRSSRDAGIDPAPRRSTPTWPVPHRPGEGRPGRGFRARRHRVSQADLHADRGRALFPPGTSGRSDRAPDRCMDHPSRPESADGHRRPRHTRNVPAPRPRPPVHQGIRHGLHRRGHPDPHQSTRSAPGERDLRTHDRKPCAASCSTGSWSSTNATCTGSSRSICTTSITHGHTEPSDNSHRPRPKPSPHQ
jgi:hypothetical protein